MFEHFSSETAEVQKRRFLIRFLVSLNAINYFAGSYVCTHVDLHSVQKVLDIEADMFNCIPPFSRRKCF
jgi:hypothetical protein